MKAYITTSVNVGGVFPVSVAVNSSTGTSTNGTPYVADYVTDTWAMLQGLMDRCAMTPSGTIEAYTAVVAGNASGQGAITGSGIMQHIQSLQYHFGAPGEIVFDFFQSANALPGTRRVLALTGSIIDGFIYPDLWYNTWVGAAANGTAPFFFTSSTQASYAAASAARTTTGLTVNGVTGGRYLVLPDCRGLSPVGFGTNGTFKNANGSGATYASGSYFPYASGTAGLGQYLADMFQGHWHPLTGMGSGGGTGRFTPDSAGTGAYLSWSGVRAESPVTDNTNGTPTVGFFTRTPSFACNIGIRY